MCENNEENIDNLLVQCKLAEERWDHVQKKLGWLGPRAFAMKGIFVEWPRMNEKSTLG